MATEDPIVATEATPKPAETDAKAKKGKKPTYFEMTKEAIMTLKERTGSSQYAITKFIEEKHQNLPANFKKLLLTQLKKFVASGKRTKVKASYKLPAAVAKVAAPAKAKVKAKPKPPAKKLVAAKKSPVKKPIAKRVKSKPAAAKKAAPKRSGAARKAKK